MQKIALYRYVRLDGGVTVSPEKPDIDCAELFRLVADENCVLTNGNIVISCIDTDTPDIWTETSDIKIINEDYIESGQFAGVY